MTPIIGIVLYGSRARGDHDQDSDVDLLAVANDNAPALFTQYDGLSISRYSLEHILRRARSGDLFAFHLVSEGKVVFEAEPVFAKIQRAFCYRSDYAREIRMASDVGWFLLHHRQRALDHLRFNQRMAWCAHTLIVARAATQRRPVFSAAGLAAFAGSSAVETVIKAKRQRSIDPAVVESFRGVLQSHGAAEPERLATLAAERRRFEQGGNPAGASALRPMMIRSILTPNPPNDGGASR